MIAGLAVQLAVAVQALASTSEPSQPVVQFVRACLQGKKSEYAAWPRVAYKDLPSAVRTAAPTRKGEYHALDGHRTAFLLVEDGADLRGYEDKVCSVAARRVKFEDAFAQVSGYMSGDSMPGRRPTTPGRTVSFSIPSKDDRHRINGYRLRNGFVLMRAAKLSLAGRQEAIRERQVLEGIGNRKLSKDEALPNK